MTTQIQVRRGTAAEWTAANPTLAAGELGAETDTNKFKVGTGATAWTSLGYSTGVAGAVGTTQFVLNLFLSAASAPTAPTSILYTPSTNALSTQTGGTAGWGLAIPAIPAATSAVYLTTALISTTTPSSELSAASWSTPVIYAQKGADGAVSLTGVEVLTNKTITGIFKETKTVISASNIDLSVGNIFTRTISTATTFTVSNTPAAGTAFSFVLDLTNGGAGIITWWAGVKWVGGTAPTLTAAGRDMLGFITHDGGTTWSGLVLGKDIK